MRIDFDCLVVWIVDLNCTNCVLLKCIVIFAYMWLFAVIDNNIRIIIIVIIINIIITFCPKDKIQSKDLKDLEG